MKTLSFVLFLLVVLTLLNAAPLRNVTTQVTQPDGSAYSCFMTGDEYYHRIHDAKGYTIIQNPKTGWFVYAEKQGLELVPGIHVPGITAPEAVGLTPNLMIDNSLIQERVERFRSPTRDQYGRAASIGTINNICIFVRFSDQTEYTDAATTYDNMFNSTTSASVKGYFKEESNNQLTVDTSFYPGAMGGFVTSYRDTHPRAYYSPWSVTNTIGYVNFDQGMARLHTMLTFAVSAIAPTIPPGLILDNDNDGCVDNVSFICKGAPDGWIDVLWPHFFALDYYNTNPPFGVPLVYINGKQVIDYNFELQVGIDTAVICHEFSHTLSFPDLYHYSFDGLDPCGSWDLMDWCSGTPQHHLTYMKWKYGQWFTIVPPLPPVGNCSLNAISSNPFACYMYQMPTGEQIWIEYRKQSGTYESGLPGSGLIFYRVDQSYYPNGNDWGPPDEVYVYRPGVNAGMPNGNWAIANFAWEQGQTAINQFTDPAPFSQSNPGFIANLNIYSIGTNTGSTISFEVGSQVPVIWTGSTDTNWYNASNWSTGAVPIITDRVIMPPMTTGWNCIVPPNPSPAVCGFLRVEGQFTLNLGANLLVSAHLNSIGRITMDGNLLQVTYDMTISNWYAGSWLQCTNNPVAQIQVGGNCLFENGTLIQLTTGTLDFSNIGVSPPSNTFTVDTPGAMLNNVTVNKTNTILNYNSSAVMMPPVTIGGNLTVNANTTFNITSVQDINLDGNLNVNPAGLMQANAGTVVLTGLAGAQSVNIANAMSYLNHLKLDNVTGVNTSLASNINIYGDFTINNGIFAANANTIYLKGNWINNIGPTAFQKGTSRVVFNGNTEQNILTPAPAVNMADFYTLELAKPTGYLSLNSSGQTVQCDFYDYTSGLLKVSDGVFTTLALSDLFVTGDFTCNAPGVINLTDITGNADLNADLIIQGGTINIFNGTSVPGAVSTWGAVPASLTMDNGLLKFHNRGVLIDSLGGTFSTNITGGTIEAAGDFLINRSEFTPSGGLIVLTASNPANIGTSRGGWFYGLRIANANVSTISDVLIYQDLQIDSTCTLDAYHNMTISGNTTVDGTFSVYGNATVYTNSITINGIMNVYTGATLQTNNDINVSGSGVLYCLGNSVSSANISGGSRGFWKMQVSGTISASYTEFRNLREEGIWVMSSGVIDSTAAFNNCLFSDCQGGASTFLTIANSQNLNIDGIVFTSTGGETYNISKTADSGNINITNASGNFAGPAYENDAYDRIYWAGYNPNLTITAFAVSDSIPYLADLVTYSVSIYNDSADSVRVPFKIHLFKNRASAPGWTETGDYNHTLSAMAGYATQNYSFTGVYSMDAEDWTSWLLIDPEGAVYETNETDNGQSETLSWKALPVVDSVSIETLTTTTGRVFWTYPIWVDRFKVYYDSDPDGGFTTHLGSTADLYYDISLSSDKLFYKVLAERDIPAR